MSRKIESRTTVIIPAAGRGTRLGGERKQFRNLGGKPLLVRTCQIFQQHPGIDRIVIVAPAEEVHHVREMISLHGVTRVSEVVEGGQSRQDSVQNGFEAVAGTTEFVLVHDGVRPFLSAPVLDRLLEAIEESGAGALALPVTDTLRRSEDDRIYSETVPRENVYRMQTPQGCRTGLMRKAYDIASLRKLQVTDEVALIQLTGHAVKVVQGDVMNIKITTESDWDLARKYWEIVESDR